MTLPKDIKRSKRIGELNGPWAFLLKTTLVFMPVIFTLSVAWSVWVTTEIFALKQYDVESRINRFEPVERKKILMDIVDLQICMVELKKHKQPEIPPIWFVDKVDKMNDVLIKNSSMLIELRTKVDLMMGDQRSIN